MSELIKILSATDSNRQAIVAMLQAEKLPVDDFPVDVDNFFIASKDDIVVGAAGIELYESHGLLRSLVVDNSYRNLSIAAKLVGAIERKAAELQLTGIYLLTETAKGYFEKKGYITVDRSNVPEAIKQSSEFSHVCPVSAVVMQKQTF